MMFTGAAGPDHLWREPEVRHPRNAWRRFEKYDGFRADFAGSVLNAPLS
jgi:hypothetical protein